jgi:signal transduction histidine kinase
MAATQLEPAGEGPSERSRARELSGGRNPATGALAPYEEQIRRAQKMETVSNLAAGVARHFNDLLAGILSASRLAARQLDDDHPALPYLAEIAASADRGAELTRKLVAFGRARQPQPRPLRAGEAIDSARTVLRELLSEDVRLSVSVVDPDARIFADPEQLEQVLVNLSLNARDAMPEGGEVALTSRLVTLHQGSIDLPAGLAAGDYVEFAVRDSGPGMDDATKARIFEPFFTTKPEGTGLGLYIVYGIVSTLGGRIDVRSQPGQGATFRILLPASATPMVALASDEGGEHRKPRILVVEDERLIRITLRHTLQAHGFEVLCAGDAGEARSLHEAMGTFDVLLTDMILPGSTGSELARELAQRQPNIGIVYMSAYPRELLLSQGRVSNESRTLEKPFTEDSLVDAVHSVLAHA